MTYEIGQPVVWAGRESDAYTQEFGPNEGKPVVYGIVTDDSNLHVWWEYCSDAYCCSEDEVEPRMTSLALPKTNRGDTQDEYV